MPDNRESLTPDVVASLESIVRGTASQPPGERVAGRYIKTELLGSGGMGDVWKAWDVQLGRWVALKFLREGVESERFVREARLAAKLAHANIAAVHDTGVTEQGRHYICMQFVDGPTLGRFSRADRRLLVELVRDAASAVHHAHGEGVIHRDLKPANLMVQTSDGARPRIFVMDFGLAKPTEADSVLSVSGAIVGTPAYMSPEQARGAIVDVRTDIWALGATLCDLLVGRPPFHGTPAEILAKLQEATPVPVRRIDPDIPRDLETIVMHCLEKDPARRYATARDLADDLTRYLAGESILARPPSSLRRLGLIVRRHAAMSAAVAAVLITLALVGATYYATPGRINLNIVPSGARVTIGTRTWTAPAEAVLPAGIYSVHIEAPDHEPQTREIAVERGRVKDLTASLQHERGLLEADASPSGAEIEVDGVAYGSRIRNLALATGGHRVRSWAVGCFEQQRTVLIRRGETTRIRLSMDEGLLWRELDSTMFGSVSTLPDLDGDGAGEFAYLTTSSVIIRSGRQNKVLWEIAGSANRTWTWRLLGRRATLVTDDTSGLLAWCVTLGKPGEQETTWTWRGPPRSYEKPEAALWELPTDDTMVVCGRDGLLHVLNSTSGVTIGQPADLGVRLTELRPAGLLLSFCGWKGDAAGRRGVCGVVRPGDAVPQWTVTVDDIDRLSPIEGTDFYWIGATQWGVVDGTSRRSFNRGRILDGDAKWIHASVVQVDVDSVWDLLVLSNDGFLSTRSGIDGSILWRIPLRALGPPDPHTNIVGFQGEHLYLSLRDGVACLDVRSGRARWEIRGPIRGSLIADWDGDGTAELFVGIEGEGLRCIDSDGRLLWALRLEHYGYPTAVLPDVDGDGLAEVVLAAFAGWSGVVRGPKILWRLQETPPLQATPAVADGNVYLFSHVSGTPRRGRVVCLESATGSLRWDAEVPASRTRAPAIADWDGDGKVDVAHSGASLSEQEFVLTVLRGTDGKPLFFMKEPATGAVDSYTTPVVSDFNGDGVKDFATSRWHTKDVWCVDGRSGSVLWRHPTGQPNMGGVAVADVDGDGSPDVVAPSIDGHVYALRGRDGFMLWSAEIGTNGSRSVPALFDVSGDGIVDVILVTVEGRLCVVDGKSGAMLWDAVRAGEGVGKPAVARVGGRIVIVAPMGSGGMVALDWERRALLWNGPAGLSALAGPAVCDLDGDGQTEVVMAVNGAAGSELVVADALTGRRLWHLPLDSKAVEADPVVCDVDGDGVLDLLVATCEGTLFAVSGKGTAGARKRR